MDDLLVTLNRRPRLSRLLQGDQILVKLAYLLNECLNAFIHYAARFAECLFAQLGLRTETSVEDAAVVLDGDLARHRGTATLRRVLQPGEDGLFEVSVI